MLNSKALKPFDEEDKKDTLWDKINHFRHGDSWLGDKFDDVMTFLENWLYYNPRAFLRNIKRFWDYGRQGWSNFDFDGHYLLDDMQFKLKRIQKCLENGHAIPNQHNELKALKICIKLGDKLKDEWKNYRRFLTMHDKKWGELETWTEKVEGSEGKPGGPYHRWLSKRVGAVTDEEKEQERKEFLEATRADEREKDRDRNLYFRILGKYLPYMWD